MKVLTPTLARKNFFNLIKAVKDTDDPVQIGTDEDDSMIMMTKTAYTAMRETLYLQETAC